MNCANHPDLPVAAYCQNCGKPLCTQCLRSVAGVVYCEPCLAARLSPGGSAFPPGASAGTPKAGSTAWSRVPTSAAYPPSGSRSPADASPVLAGFLGAIPGVGAMYNGQFVKAFAHVVIFVILVGITDHFDAAGMLVAAWIFYQIFDAIQTAIARNQGKPLPDPFGLNDLGQRMGVPAAPYVPPAAPFAPAEPPAAASPDWTAANPNPAPGFGSEQPPPVTPMPDPTHPDFEAWAHRVAAEKAFRDAGIPVPPGQYQPVPPLPPAAYVVGRQEPVGAIVLIAVGMLFLLSTLHIFRLDWIGRGWPILIILLGAGLLFKRLRSTPRIGGGL